MIMRLSDSVFRLLIFLVYRFRCAMWIEQERAEKTLRFTPAEPDEVKYRAFKVFPAVV